MVPEPQTRRSCVCHVPIGKVNIAGLRLLLRVPDPDPSGICRIILDLHASRGAAEAFALPADRGRRGKIVQELCRSVWIVEFHIPESDATPIYGGAVHRPESCSQEVNIVDDLPWTRFQALSPSQQRSHADARMDLLAVDLINRF